MDDDNSRISNPRVLTNLKILRIKYGHPTKSLVGGGKTRPFVLMIKSWAQKEKARI